MFVDVWNADEVMIKGVAWFPCDSMTYLSNYMSKSMTLFHQNLFKTYRLSTPATPTRAH